MKGIKEVLEYAITTVDEQNSVNDLNRQIYKIDKKIENLLSALSEIGISEFIKNQLTLLESQKQMIQKKMKESKK